MIFRVVRDKTSVLEKRTFYAHEKGMPCFIRY